MTPLVIKHFHLACGLGGGAKGMNRGKARVRNLEARFRCIGGVDVDPAAIRDFERLSGVKGTVLDLFSRKQYQAFHGKPPPAGWREATSADLRRAAGGESPDVIVTSMPCKGFSGLCSESRSKTAKYQALNELTLRSVWLALDTWSDDPPAFFVFENVPRIATRGRHLLDQIKQLLQAFGYAVEETKHDCGELGGLAQTRKRFLLMARHMAKVPPFLYEPEKRPLRAVGDVLGRMPMPGDLRAGPMHRLPALQWKTWVRLAFVKAGGDWRSLRDLRVENGYLADYLLVPEMHRGVLGVTEWGEHASTLTSNGRPQSGKFSVADPRIDGHHKSVQFGVRRWEEVAGVVTGKMFVGGGPNSVADPRVDEASGRRFNNVYRVVRWSETSPAVYGGATATSNAAAAVADPRPGFGPNTKHHVLRVTPWDKRGGTVTASRSPGGGALCVADPRPEWKRHSNNLKVVDWVDTSPCAIAGGKGVQGGWLSVADPRNGRFGVHGWTDHTGTIQGESFPSNGAFSVADPRLDWKNGAHENKMRVTEWEKHARAVTGSDRVGSGALCVADPRPACIKREGDDYKTGGHYGVVPWGRHANVVSANGVHDNGFNNVADPRLPAAEDRVTPLIIAADGTYHRPFTTFEMAGLQSLVDPEEYLELEGLSDSAWRERIGNAIPPEAMEAIAGVIGETLLLTLAGDTKLLRKTDIWVRDIAIALSLGPT